MLLKFSKQQQQKHAPKYKNLFNSAVLFLERVTDSASKHLGPRKSSNLPRDLEEMPSVRLRSSNFTQDRQPFFWCNPLAAYEEQLLYIYLAYSKQ